MRTTTSPRSLAVGLVLLFALAVATTARAAGPLAGVPPGISLADGMVAGAPAVALAGLQPGDRIFCSGDRAPAGDAVGLLWREAGAGADHRWEAEAGSAAGVALRLDTAALRPGDVVIVGVDRALGDGVVLQTNRRLVVTGVGGLEAGPASVARIEQGFRLSLRPGANLGATALERDAAGRILVGNGAPGLDGLLAQATRVEPFVTAQVVAALGTTSISGENGQNLSYAPYPCGGPYYGTTVIFTTAPGSATVTSTDISYKVYNSVDISRVRVAGFRGGVMGYVQTDFLYLYQATSSGSTTLDRTHNGLNVYNGEPVNYLYLVGCCNDGNPGDSGYLDWWKITLYYNAPASIDLIADSVLAGPSSVAAGASTSVIFGGQVAGTGSVGGPFGVALYLSPDSNITTGDTKLWEQTTTWAANPGDHFGYGSPGIAVTIPGATPAGTYYLGMIVDHTGVIAESNEANNVAWTQITVTAAGAKPNLEAVSCSVSPTTTTAGGTVQFTYRGRNSGTAGAADFVWFIYLSTDSVITPGVDTGLLGLDVPGGWNPGVDTGDVTQSVHMPASLADGTYYLGIYLDSTSVISETNENDNYCSAVLTVGTGGGPKIWVVPAAAATTGFGGARWTGQLAITNPTGSARTATVYYVPKGDPWPGAVLSGPHTVPPNQSVFIDNPVGALAPTTGLLYVVLDDWGPVVASRVFVLNDDGSTYGQGIPGFPLDAVPGTDRVLPLAHSVPGQFHANLGLIHPATGSYTVEVAVFSPGGTLLAMKMYTRSQAWEQISDLFADMGIGGTAVQGAWIRVRVTSGTASTVHAYVSVVDDRTKDPTYFLAFPSTSP